MSARILINGNTNAETIPIGKIFHPIIAEAVVDNIIMPIEYDLIYSFYLSQAFSKETPKEDCISQAHFIIVQQPSVDRCCRLTVASPGRYVVTVEISHRLRRTSNEVEDINQTGLPKKVNVEISKFKMDPIYCIFDIDASMFCDNELSPSVTVNEDFITPVYYVPPNTTGETGYVRVIAKPVKRMVNGFGEDLDKKEKTKKVAQSAAELQKQNTKEMKELLSTFSPPLFIPQAEEFRFENIVNKQQSTKHTTDKIYNNVQKYRPPPRSHCVTPWITQPKNVPIYTLFNNLQSDIIYRFHHQFKNAKTGKIYELKEPIEYQTFLPQQLQKSLTNIEVHPQFALEKRDREWVICSNTMHALGSSNSNNSSSTLISQSEFEKAQQDVPVITTAYGVPLLCCNCRGPNNLSVTRVILVDRYGIIGLASGMCDWLHPGYVNSPINHAKLMKAAHRSILSSSSNSTLYPDQKLVQLTSTSDVLQSIDLGRLNEELREKFPHLPPMVRITTARQAARDCYALAGQCEISLTQDKFIGFRSFLEVKKPKSLKNVKTEDISILAAMVLLVGTNGVVLRAWCIMDEPCLIYDIGRQTPEFIELSSVEWSKEGVANSSLDNNTDTKAAFLVHGKKHGSIPGFFGKYALVHSYIDQLDVNKTKMDILFTLPRQAAILRLCEENFPTPEDELVYLEKLKENRKNLLEQEKRNEEIISKLKAKKQSAVLSEKGKKENNQNSEVEEIADATEEKSKKEPDNEIPEKSEETKNEMTNEAATADSVTEKNEYTTDIITSKKVPIAEEFDGNINENTIIKPDFDEPVIEKLETIVQPKTVDVKDVIKETIMFSKNKSGVVSAYFNTILGDIIPLCVARSNGKLHIIANSVSESHKKKQITKIEHIIITLPKWIEQTGTLAVDHSDKSGMSGGESTIFTSDQDGEFVKSDACESIEDIEHILKSSSSSTSLNINTNGQKEEESEISVSDICSPSKTNNSQDLNSQLFLSKAHNILAPKDTLESEILSRYAIDEGYAIDAKVLCLSNKTKSTVIAWKKDNSGYWNIIEVSQEHVVYAVKVKSPEVDILPSF